MKNFIKSIVAGAFFAAFSAGSAQAAILASSDSVPRMVENGWYGDGLAITLVNSVPTGCVLVNEFWLEATHPGYKNISKMVIGASLASRKIRVVFDNAAACVSTGRASVVSVQLLDN